MVNTPGSARGALECLDAILDVVPHALALLEGDAHAPEVAHPTPDGPAPGSQ